MRRTGQQIVRAIPLSIVVAVAMTATALAGPGELDPTFSGDGIVRTDFTAGIDQAYAVAVGADGKVVVAGGAPYSKNASFAIARYNPDGTLDTTFSIDGKVRVNLSRYYDAAWGVAIQPDGKIIAAGDYSIGSGNSGFAVLRFTEGGTLDATFGGGDGKVITQFTKHDDGVAGVALQVDGRILVSGGAASDTRNSRIAIARYTTDGALDSTFGGDGTVTTALGDWAFANAVGVQSDGKIVAAGIAYSSARSDRFAVVRYNTDGTLDTTFSGDGTTVTGFSGKGDAALKMAIQGDDKVVVAGMAATGTANQRFAVARYDPDGSLDSTFGGGDGKVVLDVTSKDDYAWGLAVQVDGKIVLAGETASRWRAVVVRLNTDGTPDPTFSGDGKTLLSLGAGYAVFYGVAVQPDGQLVAAGAVDSEFLIVRYLA